MSLSTVLSLLISSSSSSPSSSTNITNASVEEEEGYEVITNDAAGNHSTFNTSGGSIGVRTELGFQSTAENSSEINFDYSTNHGNNNLSLTTASNGFFDGDKDDDDFFNTTTTTDINNSSTSTIISNTTKNFGFGNYNSTLFDTQNNISSSNTSFSSNTSTNFGFKNTPPIIRRKNITKIISNCTQTHVQVEVEYPDVDYDDIYTSRASTTTTTTEYSLDNMRDNEPAGYAPIFYFLLICVLGVYVYLYFLSRHLKAKAQRVMEDEQKQKVEDRSKRGGCRYDFEDENEMSDYGPQEQNLSMSALRFYGGRAPT